MIRPINDKVAVKVTEVASKSKGGIELLQPIEGDAPITGTVVAVGPGNYNDDGYRETLEVAVGDVVAYPANAGVVIADYGVTVLHEAEIIAIVS